MRVYVGTSLHNADRACQLINKFLDAGILVTYQWTQHGQIFDDEELTKVGKLEIDGVRDCDLFFMIQPGRAGTHCELGIAIALDKPIVILEEIEAEKKTFYYQPNVYRYKTELEAFTAAIEILQRIKQ